MPWIVSFVGLALLMLAVKNWFMRRRVHGLLTGLAGALLFVLPHSPVAIDSGDVGVHLHLGKARPKTLQPGLNFVWPFIDEVVPMSTQLRAIKVKADAGSSDLQVIHTTISVLLSMNEKMAAELYSNVGDLDKVNQEIVAKAIQESLKSVTAKYTAEKIIMEREEIKGLVTAGIQGYVRQTLEEKGVSEALTIINVAIQDFDFDPTFDTSIEEKVVAEQDNLVAKNKGKELVVLATAKRDASIAISKAKSSAAKAKSTAKSAALKREQAALKNNAKVVDLRTIESWKGAMPRYLTKQPAVPFLNLGSGDKGQPNQ